MLPRSKVLPQPQFTPAGFHPSEITKHLAQLQERISRVEEDRAVVRQKGIQAGLGHEWQRKVDRLWELSTGQQELLQLLQQESARGAQERRKEQEKSAVLFNQVVRLSKSIEALEKRAKARDESKERDSAVTADMKKMLSSLSAHLQRLSEAVKDEGGRTRALEERQNALHQSHERMVAQCDQGLRQHLSSSLQEISTQVGQQRKVQDAAIAQEHITVQRSLQKFQAQVDSFEALLHSSVASARQEAGEQLNHLQGRIIELGEERDSQLQALKQLLIERQGSLCDEQKAMEAELSARERNVAEKISELNTRLRNQTEELSSIVRSEVKARMKNEHRHKEQVDAKLAAIAQAMETFFEKHSQSTRRKISSIQSVLERKLSETTQELQARLEDMTRQQNKAHEEIERHAHKIESKVASVSAEVDKSCRKLQSRLTEVEKRCSEDTERVAKDARMRSSSVQREAQDGIHSVHEEVTKIKEANRVILSKCTALIERAFHQAEAKVGCEIERQLDHALKTLKLEVRSGHSELEERLSSTETFSVMESLLQSLEHADSTEAQDYYWSQQSEYNDYLSSELERLADRVPFKGAAPYVQDAVSNRSLSLLQTELRKEITAEFRKQLTDVRDAFQVEAVLQSVVDTVVAAAAS